MVVEEMIVRTTCNLLQESPDTVSSLSIDSHSESNSLISQNEGGKEHRWFWGDPSRWGATLNYMCCTVSNRNVCQTDNEENLPEARGEDLDVELLYLLHIEQKTHLHKLLNFDF